MRWSNRATPRSKKSSWRAPAAAARRRRRHEPAFAHRRHAVGELAVVARRGRSASGPGYRRGRGRADLLFDDGATKAFWIVILRTPSSGFPLRSSMAAGSRTGTNPAFRSIFSTPRPVSTPCSSASPWRTTRSLVRRCTSHPRRLLGFAFGQPLPLFSVAVLPRGLPPCLYLHPMVDSQQSRPVDCIVCHRFAVLLSAQGSCGSPPLKSSFRSPRTHCWS